MDISIIVFGALLVVVMGLSQLLSTTFGNRFFTSYKVWKNVIFVKEVTIIINAFFCFTDCYFITLIQLYKCEL